MKFRFVISLLIYIAIISVVIKTKWKKINEELDDFYIYLNSDKDFNEFVQLKKDEELVNQYHDSNYKRL